MRNAKECLWWVLVMLAGLLVGLALLIIWGTIVPQRLF